MAGAIPKQTQEDIVPPKPIAIGYRLGAVLLTAPVAAVMQLVLDGPVGLGLRVPESPGSSTLADLSILKTVVITLAVSVAAWIAVVILERSLGAERGRQVWTWAATGVFVLSLLAIIPLDVTAGQAWGLVALHSVVALLLIPSMTAKGTPGEHPPTNVGEPASPGDVGDDDHDGHDHDEPGHGGAGADHVDDEYAHAAPAADAHDDSAHDDPLDH